MHRVTRCFLQLDLCYPALVRTASHRPSTVESRASVFSTLRKSRKSGVTIHKTANFAKSSVDNSFWTSACLPKKALIAIILNYTLPDQVEKLLSKGIVHFR